VAGIKFTLAVFRRFFMKSKAPLTGAPAVRRMKTYSAQSGYVYQYFYEGHRSFDAGGERELEFVFQVSADRKTWSDLSVLVGASAVGDWEKAHARELSPTERYAMAKMALFQAFDEREGPAQMREHVRVRNADIDGIVETLGL
jgi:hypothetical protein